MERRQARTVVFYVALLGAAVAAYLAVRARGAGLEEGLRLPVEAAPPAPAPDLARVMLALAVVMLAAQVLGRLGRRWLGQPPVIGEVVAGIVLGPSLLGVLAPGAHGALFPPSVVPSLGLISKIGVVLFMFVVGLELDVRLLRRNTQTVVAISHASIVVPFLLGSVLALWFHPLYAPRGVGFTPFSLFLGISLSVTAFPVLARILRDREMHRTPLGMLALACAAVGDATAWALLALVVGMATADVGGALWTLPLAALYLAVMFFAVRPVMRRLAARVERGREPLDPGTLALVLVGLLLSASATDRIGIHPLFGAFLFGALTPHDGRLADGLRVRIEDMVVVLLLPAFFAFTGLRTEIGLLQDARDWLLCGVVIAAATAGKWGGSFLAARLRGMGARDAAALGVLMNTRGLMELIVLNIGLDLGVLSPTLFTMLVLMALATTFLTSPVFGALTRSAPWSRPAEG
ncbi:MAG TPA: cation:proton antiporter [Vicinamibacteria bacterium]